MTTNMAGQNVEELHAHRRAVVNSAPFGPRRPAWMDDEDALREAAREAAGRIHDEEEWLAHHYELVNLGFAEPRP